ncbi:hypothetical protein GCM10010435_06050 [Winogradskya consettensis]|uniref:Uncharacterized protein n=1 Tax=Winogradskya consettensis TaxID=113560 RepID=A0A919SXV7_9ACTN|nr:hypothetical protein [Actinoplanes consettensis]GIM79401.1 hypothetical protein Aco04nite_65320 [Actinoplanes consettensis]
MLAVAVADDADDGMGGASQAKDHGLAGLADWIDTRYKSRKPPIAYPE